MIRTKIKLFKIKNAFVSLVKYRCIILPLVRAKVVSAYASKIVTRCLRFERILKNKDIVNKSIVNSDKEKVKKDKNIGEGVVSEGGNEISSDKVVGNSDIKQAYVQYIRYVDSLGLKKQFNLIRDICDELIVKNYSSGYFQIIKKGFRKGDRAILSYIKFTGLDIFERENTKSNKLEKVKKAKNKQKFAKKDKLLHKSVDSRDKQGGRIHRTQSR